MPYREFRVQNKKDQYIALLDEEKGEQDYQSYLEENTEFIPRHFVQNHGIHFSLLIRKLKISNDMITDFAFLSKSSIGWNYVLIEIEKPQSKFFKPGTTSPHSDFLQGISQIKSWQAWFKDAGNKAHFESQLLFLKKPIEQAPVTIRYVLVTGRRSEYENSPEKIRLINSYEDHDFKIMSFDSLAENIEHNCELYLGIRKQGSIEIQTKTLINKNIFDWCDESTIHLTNELKNTYLSELDQIIASCSGNGLQKFQAEQARKLHRKISNMKTINA